MQRLVIATGNPHKLAEIRAVLTPIPGLHVLGLPDLGPMPPEPAESGATFRDNASIKARAYAALTGLPCLADDSGLEIDALGGAPGVISSHYGTGGIDTGLDRANRDADNNRRVLRELEGIALADRSARFRCVLVVARPDGGLEHVVEGTFEGRIGVPPRVPSGANGFGYDPLFLVGPRFERTSAELLPEEKQAVSHRGVALRNLLAAMHRTTPQPD